VTRRHRAHEEEPIETPAPVEEPDDPITPPKRDRGKAAPPKEEAPPPARQPDFMWSGLPVYRCGMCGDQYERVSNLQAVIEHEKTQHPTNARTTGVLGPDGRPLIVVS